MKNSRYYIYIYIYIYKGGNRFHSYCYFKSDLIARDKKIMKKSSDLTKVSHALPTKIPSVIF